MDSEALVVVAFFVGFFLVIGLFLYLKPQFFVLLNRLAKLEFRSAKNPKPKVENSLPQEIRPWPWYQAWTSTLFHPIASTGKVLLSEGRISFRQTFIWLMVVSALAELSTSVIPFIKNPTTLTARSLFILGLSSLLVAVISPIGMLILTAGLHLIAKLCGGKGSWRNFFIVWVAFNAPVLILFYLSAFVYQVFAIQGSLILDACLSFYWLFVVNPLAIKSNYGFRWLGSCLINSIVMAVFFVGFMGLFMALNPGLFQR